MELCQNITPPATAANCPQPEGSISPKDAGRLLEEVEAQPDNTEPL